jgi:small subunit ribosomal protein S9
MASVIQYYGTGRRKTSVARVFLRPGKGSIKINDRNFDEYFPNKMIKMIIKQPLSVTDTLDRFDIKATVKGGGISAQAGALRHGISKALLEYNKELRKRLKVEGLLTRDPRQKERKKYGQPGARKRFQYSKR